MIAIFAELGQGGGKEPRSTKNCAAQLNRGDRSDAKIEKRQSADGGDPTFFPKQRDEKDREKDKSETESKDQQQGQNERALEPFSFFLELGDEQFQACVQRRAQSREHGSE